MKTILLQGDSVTDGRHSRENDNNPGYCYPIFIKGKLDYNFPGEYRLLNRGIAGNHVADVYARIQQDIINLKPDVLSILIGVNDVWGFFSGNNTGTEPDKFCRIYTMLIEEVREKLPDTQIMILEPFILKGKETQENWEPFYAELRKYAALIQKIAEKYGLCFVPLQDVFNRAAEQFSPDHWMIDGIHPTVEGAALLAGEWMKAFWTLEQTHTEA